MSTWPVSVLALVTAALAQDEVDMLRELQALDAEHEDLYQFRSLVSGAQVFTPVRARS